METIPTHPGLVQESSLVFALLLICGGFIVTYPKGSFREFCCEFFCDARFLFELPKKEKTTTIRFRTTLREQEMVSLIDYHQDIIKTLRNIDEFPLKYFTHSAIQRNEKIIRRLEKRLCSFKKGSAKTQG